MKKLSLEEVIEGIEDNRRAHSVIYPLKEILFIMLTAIICGATSYVRIEMFANSRIEWLKKYLKLENGVPDANTFRYVMMKITPEKIHEVFAEWNNTELDSYLIEITRDILGYKDENGELYGVPEYTVSYTSPEEAVMAYQTGKIKLQDEIVVRREVEDKDGNKVCGRVRTSVGKIIFNSI